MGLVGVAVGVLGVLMPLVELRPNRLVPGTAASVLAAGPAAAALLLALVVAGLAAWAPRTDVRRAAAVVSPGALIAAEALTLGVAASRLLEGAPATARVSLSAGAWVLLAAAAVAALASSALEPRPRRLRWASAAVSALVVVAAFRYGGLDQLSLVREYSVRAGSFWPLMGGHVALSASALAAAAVLGVPLGLWASRDKRVRAVVLAVTGAIQTVPSLALLGLLVVPLAALGAAFPALREAGIRGIGATPGLIALTMYALLPIVRGTYLGLSGVDPAVLDAGRGMGMSRAQLLARVELPLALPLIADGVRTAAVLVVGIATLTVFAGARNLGVLVFEGLGQFAPDLVLLGALPIVALAVAADVSLGAAARLLTPKGVRT